MTFEGIYRLNDYTICVALVLDLTGGNHQLGFAPVTTEIFASMLALDLLNLNGWSTTTTTTTTLILPPLSHFH